MLDKINKILEKVFKLSTRDSQLNLQMSDVGNWDSLTHMDLIVTIEEEFNIELSGDDIADMISFEAIRTLIGKYLA